MPTITDKLPKLPEITLPEIKLPEALDLDEAKKPAFAAAGLVDLYVEQLKALPAEAKKIQAELTTKFEARRTARTAQVKAVPTQVKALPADAKKLQAELTATLTSKVTKAQADATAYYGKLAVRGEKLVAQIRKQPATEATLAEGKAAVKKAEAATTSAKKSAKSAVKATEGATEKLG